MGFRVKVGQKAYVEKSCCAEHGVDHTVNEEHVPVMVVAQVTVKTFHSLEKLYRVVFEDGHVLEVNESDLVTKQEVEKDDKVEVPEETETETES